MFRGNGKTNWKGFTIVELLIVVVVIAILAAITVVAYNGITASANDSRMRTEAKSFEKVLSIRHVEHGGYYDGSKTYPQTSEEAIARFGLQSMSDRLVFIDYGGNYEKPEDFDKAKIYVQNGLECLGEYSHDTCSIALVADGLAFSYWSNADNAWLGYYLSGDSTLSTLFPVSYESGPLQSLVTFE